MKTILIIGQSQVEHLWTFSTQGLTSLAGGKRFQRPNPSPIAIYNVEDAHHAGEYDIATVANADGVLTLCNVLGSALNDTVLIDEYAVGGSGIPTWVSPNGIYYKASVSPTTGFAACGYPVDATWFSQGATDAALHPPMTYADYLANLQNVIAWAPKPFFISPLGYTTGAAIADGWDGIRQAHLWAIDNIPGVFWGGGELELAHQDTFHLNGPSRVTFAKRFAQAYLRQQGLATSGYGPKITGATYSGNTITVTVAHDGGTGLTAKNLSTSGAGLTGFRVFSNGVLKTVTSTAFIQPDKITLTLAAALVAPVTLDYHYGARPNITNPVYDDQPPFGDANGLPLQPSRGQVTATFQ